jgi:hypothetical protein
MDSSIISNLLFGIIGIGGSAILVYLKLKEAGVIKKKVGPTTAGAATTNTPASAVAAPVSNRGAGSIAGLLSGSQTAKAAVGLLNSLLFLGVVIAILCAPYALAKYNGVSFGDTAVIMLVLGAVLGSKLVEVSFLNQIGFWLKVGFVVAVVTPVVLQGGWGGYPWRVFDSPDSVLISYKPTGRSLTQSDAMHYKVSLRRVVNPALVKAKLSDESVYHLCLDGKPYLAAIDSPATKTGLPTYVHLPIGTLNSSGVITRQVILLSGGTCTNTNDKDGNTYKVCGEGGSWSFNPGNGELATGAFRIVLGSDVNSDIVVVLYKGKELGEQSKWATFNISRN